MATLIDKFDFEVVTRFKEEKVRHFLNHTHNYIIQNELRESFENEVWKPTDIPTFYYDSLHYLITGESLNLRSTYASTQGTKTIPSGTTSPPTSSPASSSTAWGKRPACCGRASR